MHTSFGGRGLSGFGDMATFQKRPNFLFRWRYGYLSKTAKFSLSLKNLIDQNLLKKFMQVGTDVKCMHTDFGGRGLSDFGDKISFMSIKVKK